MGEPGIFKVELQVESFATNTEHIKKDIQAALAPLGLYPHISKIERKS